MSFVYAERMSTGGWVVSIAIVVLLVAVIAALVVWIIDGRRGPTGSPREDVSPHSPDEILSRRLAAGEIGEDEYRRLHSVLAEGQAPNGGSGRSEPANPAGRAGS